jgi:hypothetical protein
MGLEEDLSPGEQLLALFRPFLEDLAASDLSLKTIQKHVDNVWALGGEFIRDLLGDPSLRKKPVGVAFRRMIEYGGPLLNHGGEDEQRSFDSTCPEAPAVSQRDGPATLAITHRFPRRSMKIGSSSRSCFLVDTVVV